MNAANKPHAPKMSLFPKVALWTLDFICVVAIAAAIWLLVGGVLGLDSWLGHHDGLLYKSLLGIGLMIFGTFFWLGHLLLWRTLQGQPFERRNIRLLYGMVAIHLAYVLISSFGDSLSWGFTLNRPESGGLPFHLPYISNLYLAFESAKAPDVVQFVTSSGFSLTLLLLGFAAIFQRGVELREEEDRLRAEQALTI